MDLGLQGKVVVVTGGTAGIGLATAKAFLQEGASVAVCGRRQELLDDAVKALGGDVFAYRADMTDEGEVTALPGPFTIISVTSMSGSIMSVLPSPERGRGIRLLK